MPSWIGLPEILVLLVIVLLIFGPKKLPELGRSLGRLGLLIHSTAGFVDAGFSGNLTLELSNVANLPITIYHGMPIGQLSFMRMDGPVERPYGSRETSNKYQGQTEPTPSRFYLNFEAERRS